MNKHIYIGKQSIFLRRTKKTIVETTQKSYCINLPYFLHFLSCLFFAVQHS